MDADSTDSPILISHEAITTGADWELLGWPDSAWATRLATGVRGAFDPAPAVSSDRTLYLLWMTPDPRTGYAHLLFSQFTATGLIPPDTVMRTLQQSSEYGGAVWGSRRWVVRIHQRYPGQLTFGVFTRYSDTLGVWRSLPELGVDEFTCAIAPLGPQRALMAYSGQSGLAWALADGATWSTTGTLDDRPWATRHPRMRLRPSGGLWMIWTDNDGLQLASYDDGVWRRERTFKCAHPDGGTYVAAWCDISRDTAERPVLAWGDLGYGYTYRDVGVVAIPEGDGWGEAEEIPGSEGLFTTPTVARDRNGDVWAAWQRLRDVVWSTHTYCSAVVTSASLSKHGREQQVRWVLSSRCPDSRWTVLRAERDGPFEPVGEMVAGADSVLVWTDRERPRGHARYRLRRECFDSRYRWESEPVGEKRDGPKAGPPWRPWPWLRASVIGPGDTALHLQVEGAAAGPAWLELYDLQGRQVARHEVRLEAEVWSGSVPLAELGGTFQPGIYFVRLADAAGSELTAKLAVVR